MLASSYEVSSIGGGADSREEGDCLISACQWCCRICWWQCQYRGGAGNDGRQRESCLSHSLCFDMLIFDIDNANLIFGRLLYHCPINALMTVQIYISNNCRNNEIGFFSGKERRPSITSTLD